MNYTKVPRYLASIVTEMMSRARFAGIDGLTFDGKRDRYTVLGYKKVLGPADYRARFERGGVAARIVEARPEDTWRGGVEVVETEDPKTVTPFEQAFMDLDDRLHISTELEQLDTIAGLGQFAVLVLGAPGKTEDELTSCTPEQLMYLSVYGEDEVTVQETDNDPESPRFGQPVQYKICRTVVAGTSTRSLDKFYHWTRVIHFADGPINSKTFGQSRLKRVWNLLDDLDKVIGGGAEAFWKRADQGLQLDVDPELDIGEEEIADMKKETEDYIHGLKRVMRTRGLKVNTLGSDVANLTPSAEGIMAQISASTGIPQRILMGSEQAKLASEQDRDSWDTRIEARRKSVAEPRIVRPFVDRLVTLKTLPQPTKGYTVGWSQLRTSNDGEKADQAKKLSDLNKPGFVVVTEDEIRERALGWEKMVPADREAIAARTAKQPTEPTPRVAEAEDKLVERLAEAIRENDVEFIDRIIGTTHVD